MMRKRSFDIILLALLALFAAIAAGGCGGGGGEAPAGKRGSLIGTPHGDLAPHLEERLGLAPTPLDGIGAVDDLGDVVMLSVPEGLTASNGHLPSLKDAFELGKAVALEHAGADEVGVLLDALELAISSPEAEDGKPFELFAVCRAGGDVHFFVALGDDGGGPVSPTRTEHKNTIEGPVDDPADVIVTEEIVPTDDATWDSDALNASRVDRFAAWAEETGAKAKATASDGPSSDLRELAEAYVYDVDASNRGQTFMIRYTIYSCHSFTNDMDYYFVTQSAQLNPSALWKWLEKGHVSWPHVYLPEQEGHMRRYLFKNYWGEDPGNAVPLDRHSPENANGVTTVTSGVSYSLSGSLGFDGKAATGSLSGGVTFDSSQSFNVSDCTVNDKAGSDGRKHQAAWEYVFADPANGDTEFYYTKLRDAPLLSRSNFQPVDQWIWTVPRSFSERWKDLRFKSEFTWTNGWSEGQLNCAWIKVDDARHEDWIWRYVGFWVPMKVPPIMALSEGQMDFASAGESKAVTFVSAVGWTARTDAEWLSVYEKSGEKTDAEGMSLHITASPNDSGVDRSTVVTLTGSDGSKAELKVFQSRY